MQVYPFRPSEVKATGKAYPEEIESRIFRKDFSRIMIVPANNASQARPKQEQTRFQVDDTERSRVRINIGNDIVSRHSLSDAAIDTLLCGAIAKPTSESLGNCGLTILVKIVVEQVLCS